MKDKSYNIILGSSSKRRQDLLKIIFNDFQIINPLTEENYKKNKPEDIVIELAEKKSFCINIKNNDLLITADTIVCCEDLILGKPSNAKESEDYLKKLSNKKHEVLTGVSLRNINKKISFCVITDVYFKKLTSQMIKYYIDNYNTLDKAGAYGIQDFGAVFVDKIIGDYYNIMGLPISYLFDYYYSYFGRIECQKNYCQERN